MYAISKKNLWLRIKLPIQVHAGLTESALPLSRASRFSFWASNLSFSLARWARDQAIHLPTKSLKEQTKTCPGQAIFESYLSQGQAGIQVFWSPVHVKQSNSKRYDTKNTSSPSLS